MPSSESSQPIVPFRPLALGALYTGIARGLGADLLAARALGGSAYTVCTALVAASHGRVTDVVEVPTDAVDAQVEHLFGQTTPSAVKLGVLGQPRTVETIFRRLERHHDGPVLLDITLSGPSGEDLAGPRVLDALQEQLAAPDLVTLRRLDAELIARMEIASLDDAQVAVQRLQHLGARRVLLRCGRLPARFFDQAEDAEDFAVDLYYDGEDFALFEAPFLPTGPRHGTSSALTMALLKKLSLNAAYPEAIQYAKAYVTEALRHSLYTEYTDAPNYFWKEDTIINNN